MLNCQENLFTITEPRSDFKTLEANRLIRWDKVKSLMSAICRGEWVPPIVVTKEGYIVDGQHRYSAFCHLCKDHSFSGHLSVLEITTKEDPVQLAIRLNSVSKKWVAEDYFRAYVILQKPAYLRLKEFMKTCGNEVRGVRASLQIIKGTYGSKVFQEGSLQLSMSEINKAMERMFYLNQVYRAVKNDRRVFKRDIIIAFYNIYPEVKHWNLFLNNLRNSFVAPNNEKSTDWTAAYRSCYWFCWFKLIEYLTEGIIYCKFIYLR